MDGINIYKITFDYDDGWSAWDNAIEHVAASSEDKAKDALTKYFDDAFDGNARIQAIHSIEKLDLSDGMILVNENHFENE